MRSRRRVALGARQGGADARRSGAGSALLAAVVLGLHAVGFFLLIAVVAPRGYELGATGVFGVGLGITAYTLGLRHAFDADHIAARSTTRRAS